MSRAKYPGQPGILLADAQLPFPALFLIAFAARVPSSSWSGDDHNLLVRPNT
jgi:hypothetical protein